MTSSRQDLRRGPRALKRTGATVPRKLPLAPPLGNRAAHVEQAFLVELARTKNDEAMTRRQLSHQRRGFFVVAVRLEELAHAKQVRAREPYATPDTVAQRIVSIRNPYATPLSH